MNTGLVYSSLFYFSSMLIFFFSSCPVFLWVLMEINLLVFIFLSFSWNLINKFYEKESMFFYFIVQSLFSFVYLTSIYFYSPNNFYMDILFISSLCGKIGIFPFYFWVLSIMNSLSYFIFVILLSIQKIPLFFILFNLSSNLILFFLGASFILGSMMIFFSFNLLEILLFSSISSSFFVLVIYLESVFFFLLFFAVYSFSLFHLIGDSKMTSKNSINMMLIFTFLSGLPPLSLFFFKFCITSFILNSESLMIFITFWTFSFLSLSGYTKYFYKSFFKFSDPYLKIKFLFSKMSFSLCMLVNLVFFISY